MEKSTNFLANTISVGQFHVSGYLSQVIKIHEGLCVCVCVRAWEERMVRLLEVTKETGDSIWVKMLSSSNLTWRTNCF